MKIIKKKGLLTKLVKPDYAKKTSLYIIYGEFYL